MDSTLKQKLQTRLESFIGSSQSTNLPVEIKESLENTLQDNSIEVDVSVNGPNCTVLFKNKTTNQVVETIGI